MKQTDHENKISQTNKLFLKSQVQLVFILGRQIIEYPI
jgi:hypothetical protein